jgi:hypothetical protein
LKLRLLALVAFRALQGWWGLLVFDVQEWMPEVWSLAQTGYPTFFPGTTPLGKELSFFAIKKIASCAHSHWT